MAAIRHASTIWKTSEGQELIEYSGSGTAAYVNANHINAQHLRDLADAALAAAEAIEAETRKEGAA